jgi:2,4-dienoyl-CoA reductase-like NADH-dependent reductase (Old Yellow Enzyme family)
MAPMTRGMSPDGVPTREVAAYYRRRAENGVGLIITEGTTIQHPAASENSSIPTFHGLHALEGWSNVVKEVHDAGGKIMPQLWHQGALRKGGSGSHPTVLSVGPSGLSLETVPVNEPMSESEISDVIHGFAEAAAAAKKIGFDGVELHGAHGYLIDQFCWSRTNQRNDRYGGDIVSRTRFAVEIIRAVRARVGENFPIILRFSQFKVSHYDAKLAHSPEELSVFLEPLVDAGVDVFHCSTRRYWEAEFEGSQLNLAGWTKKLTGKPTITVGSVGIDREFALGDRDARNGHIAKLIEMFNQEQFDLVAVGRALLADPQWVVKTREHRTHDMIPIREEHYSKLT